MSVKQKVSARERMRSKQITLGEVFDILNEHNVAVDLHAQSKLFRVAKEPRTIKNLLRKACIYTVAFFQALAYTVVQKLNIKGKYSKGGVICGRKNM